MSEKAPAQIIRELAAERAKRSDDEVLAEIEQMPALADEADPIWDDPAYWINAAYRYVALSHVAAERKLRLQSGCSSSARAMAIPEK